METHALLFWLGPGRGPKGKRIRAGWIRTTGQLQLVMFTTVANGLRFGRSSTPWNSYEVNFHMELDSCLYLA